MKKSSMQVFFILGLIFSSVSSLQAHAQLRERFYLWGQKNFDQKGVEQQGELWASERILLDQDGANLLQLGVQVRATQIGENLTSGGMSHNNLSSLWAVVPQAYWLYSFNDEYSLIANLRVGTFSDQLRFALRDFRVEGAVIVDKVLKNGMTVGLGASRTTNLGRLLYLPLLHILYPINDKWLLDVILPGRGEIAYLPDNKTEIGAMFNVVGSVYRSNALQNVQTGVDQIGAGEVQFGPFYRYQIAQGLYLGAETGVTFMRRLQFLKNGEIVEQGDEQLYKFNPTGLGGYGRLWIQARF